MLQRARIMVGLELPTFRMHFTAASKWKIQRFWRKKNMLIDTSRRNKLVFEKRSNEKCPELPPRIQNEAETLSDPLSALNC